MCTKKQKCECPGIHFGATWEYEGPAGEALDWRRSALDVNLRSPGCICLSLWRKDVSCVFRCPSAAESLLLQVPAPKLQALGWKSLARWVHRAIEKRLHSTCARVSVRFEEPARKSTFSDAPTAHIGYTPGGGCRHLLWVPL